jgi:cytochrome c oxidase cbb3-type subunit III
MSNPNVRAHSFDGIEEFDNRLPNWWLWSFYLACFFSVGYWIHYHTIGTGDLPSEAFAVEQKAAAARLEAQLAANPINDEALLKLAKEPAFVAEGEKIFKDMTKCALCHKPDGGGLIGPNLTDDMWIYGSRPMDIYESILKGRPRGMLAHEAQGIGFVQRATAYVLSMKNTNVAGGKPPEPDAKKAP